MTDTTATTPSTVKKILTGLDIAAAALLASGQFPGVPTQVLGVVCAVLTVLGYGNTKQQLATLGKAAVMMLIFALPLIAVATQPGCTHAQVVAGENAAEACGKTAAGSLLGQIASALASSDYNVAVAAAATAWNLTDDAVKCLVATVTAVEDSEQGSDAGSAAAVMVARDDAWHAKVRTNGHAWLSAHGGK